MLARAWLWELAHGEDGNPYSQVGAIGGVAYLLAIAFLRWRASRGAPRGINAS